MIFTKISQGCFLIDMIFQLAEVICEESALRQENRKMSVIIAEAQTVTHIIIIIIHNMIIIIIYNIIIITLAEPAWL